jgi:hypothetical protein
VERGERAQELGLVIAILVAARGGVECDPGGFLAIEAGARSFLVRVRLQRERLIGGQQLQQERQVGAELGVDVRTERAFGIGCDHLTQGAVTDNARGATRMGAHPELGFRFAAGSRAPAKRSEGVTRAPRVVLECVF